MTNRFLSVGDKTPSVASLNTDLRCSSQVPIDSQQYGTKNMSASVFSGRFNSSFKFKMLILIQQQHLEGCTSYDDYIRKDKLVDRNIWNCITTKPFARQTNVTLCWIIGTGKDVRWTITLMHTVSCFAQQIILWRKCGYAVPVLKLTQKKQKYCDCWITCSCSKEFEMVKSVEIVYECRYI